MSGAGGGGFVGLHCQGTSNTPKGWDSNAGLALISRERRQARRRDLVLKGAHPNVLEDMEDCVYHELTMRADWPDILNNISPYMYAYTGIGLALGLSVIGAAWGIWTTGVSLVGIAVKAPRVRSRNLVSIIFCEATAIYGLIIAVILSGKVNKPPSTGIPTRFCADAYFASYAYFWGGLAVGVTNLIGGAAVGISGSNTVIADAMDQSLFVKTLIVGIMASALSIFGVIVGILMGTGVDFPNF